MNHQIKVQFLGIELSGDLAFSCIQNIHGRISIRGIIFIRGKKSTEYFYSTSKDRIFIAEYFPNCFHHTYRLINLITSILNSPRKFS